MSLGMLCGHWRCSYIIFMWKQLGIQIQGFSCNAYSEIKRRDLERSRFKAEIKLPSLLMRGMTPKLQWNIHALTIKARPGWFCALELRLHGCYINVLLVLFSPTITQVGAFVYKVLRLYPIGFDFQWIFLLAKPPSLLQIIGLPPCCLGQGFPCLPGAAFGEDGGGAAVEGGRWGNPLMEVLPISGYYHLDPCQCFFTHLVVYHRLDSNTRFRLIGENLPSYIIANRNACSSFMLSKIWQYVVCSNPNGFSKERCLNVSANYRALNFGNCLKVQSGSIFGIADFPEWHWIMLKINKVTRGTSISILLKYDPSVLFQL